MANIKSNIKTKKQSDKRHAANRVLLTNLKNNIKKVKASKDSKDLNNLYACADSLGRKHVIHKNKANRIKSRNAKLLAKKTKTSNSTTKEEKVVAKDENKTAKKEEVKKETKENNETK